MKMMQGLRMSGGIAGVLTACLALSACTGSPTYGTGKSSMEQLVEDLGSSVSLTGNQENRNLKYTPRPGLVVPANANTRQLNQPQQSLASRETNPQWVEAPEETRERLREEAEANKNNPNYRSPLLAGNGTNGQMTESQKWEAFRQAKAQASGGNAVNGQRKYLTDPPTGYRSASQEDLNDLGEPEQKKAKRLKKEAAAAKKGSQWWMPFQ